MALFAKATSSIAYLKMGIYGEAGSGKTYTASLIARGLALLIAGKSGGKKPPVMFLDTETGASWVRPIFDKAGIEFLTASTRSFSDLKQAVGDAEKAGAILIVDSMTHFWEEIRESYVAAKRERLSNPHAKLELPDWGVLKPEWAKFTSLFLNSQGHIILCGRAGSIYETQEDEESGRKQQISAGTRMAAEKGMGYEPSLLVEMTTRQVVTARRGKNKPKSIIRIATVLKDRSDLLDGLQFNDPTFENFLPHIEFFNLGGAHAGVDTTRTSEALFPSEGEARDPRAARRRVALGAIQDLLVLHYPGQTSVEKQTKIKLLRSHFSAGWVEMEELMPLESLQLGLKSLRAALEPPEEAKPAGDEFTTVSKIVDDDIPHLEPKPATADVSTKPETVDTSEQPVAAVDTSARASRKRRVDAVAEAAE